MPTTNSSPEELKALLSFPDRRRYPRLSNGQAQITSPQTVVKPTILRCRHTYKLQPSEPQTYCGLYFTCLPPPNTISSCSGNYSNGSAGRNSSVPCSSLLRRRTLCSNSSFQKNFSPLSFRRRVFPEASTRQHV